MNFVSSSRTFAPRRTPAVTNGLALARHPVQCKPAGGFRAVSRDWEAPIDRARAELGTPLPQSTRRFLEQRFGHDFSDVRIYSSAQAAQATDALWAQAFTAGRDIVFGANQFAPETQHGRELLAHELTHVVQQENGVAHAQARTDLVSSGDASEREADRAAQMVNHSRKGIAPIVTTASGVQRKPVGLPGTNSAWSGLPADARTKVTQKIFDAFNPAQQVEFRRVYSALKNVGYWKDVVDVRYVNLEFDQVDATVGPALESSLSGDKRFCVDRGITNIRHQDKASFRQVVRPGTEGLHISIPPKGIGTATLHLDTVSPVIGRGESGSCAIGIGVGIEHLLRDVAHIRGELPHAPGPSETPF